MVDWFHIPVGLYGILGSHRISYDIFLVGGDEYPNLGKNVSLEILDNINIQIIINNIIS